MPVSSNLRGLRFEEGQAIHASKNLRHIEGLGAAAYELGRGFPVAHTHDLIISELHVRNFTNDPSSGLDDATRGHYAGVIAKILYLKQPQQLRNPNLYQAIDSTGATIDFLLSALRDAAAAKRLFRQALRDPSHPPPRVINTNTDQARVNAD